MNCEQAREWMASFLETDEEVPPEAAAHIRGCPECVREAQGQAEIWSLMGDLGSEPSSERMRARFYDMLEERAHELESRTSPFATLLLWWPRRPALQAGVAMAALVLGVLIGAGVIVHRTERQAIQSLRSRMDSMGRAVTLSLLAHQSPSERLRGVSLASSSPDPEIMQALMHLLIEDPSVNVRLAALEALTRFPESQDIREGVYRAFPLQTSIPMQAAMIDAMLAMNGPRSRKEIQRAASDESLSPAIRDYAIEAASRRGKGI